jgi:hypothetical protein
MNRERIVRLGGGSCHESGNSMIHHNQDSERHEVFGVKEFKKQK